MQQDLFAALGDPTRRQLVNWLAVRPATATELARRLPITRQAVAKHLEVLDEARLIERARSGRDVRYSLRADGLAEAERWLATVSERWGARLQKLKRHLEEGDQDG